MRLHDRVVTSNRVATTTARLGKIGLLADALRALAPDEIEPGVAFLGGSVRQRRLGLGHAAAAGTRPVPATAPSLTLREVDDTFARIASIAGAGAGRERQRLLGT